MQRAKGRETLAATDKCLAKIRDARVKILENVYKMLCESKLMYGVKVLVLEEMFTEINKIHGRFCKKLLQVLRSTVNGVAELELGWNSRRGRY
jgi:transposase